MNPRLLYLEGAARGSNPVRLVILLYAQAIEDLRRALAAHARGDIESRTKEINHAILVIGYLQATLDQEQGSVAANLDRFYNQVRAGLVEAQCQQSGAGLERQISHLMLLREAWDEVEQTTASSAMQESAPAESTARSDRSLGKWKA